MLVSKDHPLFNNVNIWNKRISDWKKNDQYSYFMSFDGVDGAYLHSNGRKLLSFSSYNYFNLNQDPKMVEIVKNAIDKYGVGTTASFALGGGYDLHDKLVKKIADFSNTEDAILFSSGYIANLGTISSLVGKEGFVISDSQNHASLMEGCQRSGGTFKVYRHNDMKSLEKMLKRAKKEKGGALVVADAVFSMDSDILDLPTVVRLCRQYNSLLMVDEAHSLGILGENGRGIEEHFGMPGSIDIKMGTFSKTISSTGGYIASTSKLVNYLRFGVLGHLFSAAMIPSTAAAALGGFTILDEEGKQRRKQLLKNVRYFKTKMRASGFDMNEGEVLSTNPHLMADIPIVPVMIYDESKTLKMTKICLDNGIFIPGIAYPGVARGKERLRITLTSGHTFQELDTVINILIMAAKSVGLSLNGPRTTHTGYGTVAA